MQQVFPRKFINVFCKEVRVLHC